MKKFLIAVAALALTVGISEAKSFSMKMSDGSTVKYHNVKKFHEEESFGYSGTFSMNGIESGITIFAECWIAGDPRTKSYYVSIDLDGDQVSISEDMIRKLYRSPPKRSNKMKPGEVAFWFHKKVCGF